MNRHTYRLECPVCHRKILVDVFLIGINHNAGVNVVCGECMTKTDTFDQFEKQNPEEVVSILKWLHDDLTPDEVEDVLESQRERKTGKTKNFESVKKMLEWLNEQ